MIVAVHQDSYHYALSSIVGKNFGDVLTFVACSNEYASLISTPSLHARPKNEIPTGSAPNANPAGTVTLGYPATAAPLELCPAALSPFTRSVTHAGPPVGATSASSLNLSITASIPSLRAIRKFASIASRYSFVVSGPFASAFINMSCPKYGISFS